jgi:hypothetical protein
MQWRHRVRGRRPVWSWARSCRATRLDRAEITYLAHQGGSMPVATAPPRKVSRLQPFVVEDLDDVLRPQRR